MCLDNALNEALNTSYGLRDTLLHRPHKQTKLNPIIYTPICIGTINNSLGKPTRQTIKILLDSGSSGCLINPLLTKKLRKKTTLTSAWKTVAGPITTTQRCTVEMYLPEFFRHKKITWTFHLANSIGYDMIVGRDLLDELGMTLDFKNHIMTWDSAEVPMKDPQNLHIHIPEENLSTEMDRIHKILDAKYAPANLEQLVNQCTHLHQQQRDKLL
jgi:hypothetical protein